MQYEVKTKRLPKSEVEVEASLPRELLDEARRKALKNFSVSLELPGFRKGAVPEKMVLEKVGESKILEEAANLLLQEHFPKIVLQEKLDILGQPKISITKLAAGNPMEFKAAFAVMPEFEIPDYKGISKNLKIEILKDEEIEATDKEIEDVLLQIRKNKAHLDYHQKNPNDKNHQHAGLDLEKEENLPKLDDELAKSAGNFKNLDELKAKIKENIILEKKVRETEKKRAAIIEELVKKTKIDLPEILVESEINKSLAQMKDEIKRAGGPVKSSGDHGASNWEAYLKHIGKSEDDLKKELRGVSENRAKTQLIFNKIAVAEGLEPNKEILENEVKEIMKLYPDAKEENARIYVATILLNQEVLKLLEN